MVAFDYIINNMDRHGANMELFENGKMGSLFDNGNSIYSSNEEIRIKGKYYGDDMEVNNFVGSRSLLDNMMEIDCEIQLGEFRKGDKMEILMVTKPDNFNELMDQCIPINEISKQLVRTAVDTGVIVKKQRGSKNKSFSVRYVVREDSTGSELEYESSRLRKIK